jgi:hypothetical protein
MARIALRNVTSVEQIDWTGFEVIGRGAYGSVFVKGVKNPSTRYAIKVGEIDRDDVEARRRAHADGLSPEVFGYFVDVPLRTLPKFVQDSVDPRGYNTLQTVEVLIMERVRPLDTNVWYDYGTPQATKARTDFDTLREAASTSRSWGWGDDHNGNWGYTRKGQPVIFDGLWCR